MSRTAPRAPHPLVRLWSGVKSAGAKALDLVGTALLVFQVVTFSWATALLVISHEFVWGARRGDHWWPHGVCKRVLIGPPRGPIPADLGPINRRVSIGRPDSLDDPA